VNALVTPLRQVAGFLVGDMVAVGVLIIGMGMIGLLASLM
jgi:hypothetical protein